MLAINDTAKVNSKVAQLKLVIDSHLLKEKYNTKFIFEKININCRVLATDYLQLHHAKWIGCTALHFAFENKDLEAVDVLLNHGADFTIKNTSGSTALHRIVEEKPDLVLEAYKLDDNFIYAVVMAHIKYSNFENPVNSDGLSHFHVACAVNSVEVVRGFLQHGVSVDHAVNRDSPLFPGFSPLHFAAENLACEVALVLLSLDANIRNKNTKEMTPVHMVLNKRLEILSQRSVNEKLLFDSEILLRLFLKIESNKGMVVIDDWGLSNLHIACTLDGTKVAESYLQNVININHTVNMDSPLWPGYTALHFAALCNMGTVESLMKKGADISIKDAKGVTPFDICIDRFPAENIYAILSLHPIWQKITLSDCKTKLTDLVFAMRDPNEFDLFFEKLSKNFNIYNSSLWPDYTPMHLAITFSKEIATASEDGEEVNMKLLRILCKHNPDMLSRKDTHGYTPLHLAFRLNRTSALDLLFEFLESYPNLTNHTDEDGLSYVHIASAKNEVSMLERLLSTSTNVNAVYKGKPLLSPVLYSGSTPLHFAVAYGSVEAVETLMKQGADEYAKDVNGMTPIHLLLLNTKASNLLKTPDLRDSVVSGIGLSHLHVVCWWDKPEVVEKLLDDGANVNGIITYKLIANAGPSKFPYLEKYHGYSPLLMAYQQATDENVELLLKRGADVFTVDTEGKALLHTVIELCSTDYYDMYIDILMERVDLQTCLRADTGMTALHVACLDLSNFENIKKLISEGEDVNAQVRADSPILKGFTPLHVILHVSNNYDDDEVDKVIGLFCKVGADVTLPNGNSKTVVHIASEWFDKGADKSRYKRVNMLLEAQRDYSVNPANVYGLSHFHIACIACNVDVVQRFLRHADIDVDRSTDFFHENFPGYSALHLVMNSYAKLYCGLLKLLRTVDLLLENGADIHVEDKHGDTPLHECARFNSLDLFERLVRGGADPNARNLHGNTPLYYYLKSAKASVGGLKILLRFGCHLNVFDAITGVGYVGVAACKLSYTGLQNLIHAVSVNFKQEMKADNLGRTIIHNIVSISSSKISASEYATLIHEISKTDCDVDSQDHLGQTALHVAAQACTFKGVSGLLMAGADVNITDVNGKTAFVYHLHTLSPCELYGESTYESNGEDDENEKTCKLLQTNKTLAIHIKKMQYCGLYVTKDNEDLACEVFENFDDKIEWSETFLRELETIKSTTIKSHSLTLYDFLSETRAVADYPTMSEMKREDVIEFFSHNEEDSFRQKFPVTAGILQLQYRKAMARPQLVESAKNAMELLIGFRLPEICSQIILVLLTNSELKSLVDSVI